MGGVRTERLKHFVELVQPGREQRRLEPAGRDAGRCQLAAYPPRAQSGAEDESKYDDGQNEVKQNDRHVIHAPNPACPKPRRDYPCEMNFVFRYACRPSRPPSLP